jgi:hypothetical protein
MSIKDKIKSAKTVKKLDSLLEELKTYKNISNKTFNACVKRAKEKLKEINKK